MDLDVFQREALATDNTARHYENEESRKDIVVALLGVAGELGTLATAYKKFLRDGPAYGLYASNVREELGDLLWYVAVLADKFDLTLSAIATSNLEKTRGRWGTHKASTHPPFDKDFPADEQLPREFEVCFSERSVNGDTRVEIELDGKAIGNSLTDNVGYDDGYRFHDAFHLAFVVVLGWSPVMRKLMGRKRKSNRAIDENEDGGRAIVIEEGIAAYIFDYGESHEELAGVRAVDFDILKTVKSMTHRLEVASKTWNDWERAIMAGWSVFRILKAQNGGRVRCNLDSQTIEVVPEART